ncbi:MAG: AEC family transporter [Granulosicoccus sp.]
MTEVSLQILNILVPSMLLAFIGLVWFHKGPEFPVPFVTTLVLNIAMPALLFHTLANSTVPVSSLGSMAVATLLVHAVFGGAMVLGLRLARKDWRLCVAHVVGNTGNLGLPVCFLAFGEEGLAYAMTFFAVQCFLLFSLGDTIIARRTDLQRIARSPVLHSVWLGVLCRFLDIELPQIALQTLQLLGQMVIPIMLITLGVSLAGMRASQLPATILWSGFRTVVALTIGLSVAELLGLTGIARGVLIIETVVPVAVFNYLLAVKHGVDSSEVSGLILVTHLAAIAYLPFVLAFVL